MKTTFERDGQKFEPAHDVYWTGADGRARVMRPWRVYYKRDGALGNYFWIYEGTRFYSPRTPKRDIL